MWGQGAGENSLPNSNNNKAHRAAQPNREESKNHKPQLRKLVAACFRNQDALLEQVASRGSRSVGFEVFRKGGVVFPAPHLPDETLGLDFCPVDDDLVHERYLQLPERSIPYGSTAQLLDEIRVHLDRYVVFPPDMRLIVPQFILYTWLYDRFPTAPILRFIGDTGNGKSRGVLVTSDLCYHAFYAPGGSS